MIQHPAEVRRHRLSGPVSPFFRAASAERRAVFGHRKALGLITGLVLAVGVTLPIVAATHLLGSATGPATNVRSGEAYVPGALAGYAGPEDWALAEGGPYGGVVLPSSEVVNEWAQAEGGYYAGFVLPRPEVVNEWALAEGGYFGGVAYVPGALAGYAGPEVWAVVEGGPFGGQAYVPGPLAGYAGPEVWAELEGGALGGLTQPSPEVVQD
jgi:hypothetical protein